MVIRQILIVAPDFLQCDPPASIFYDLARFPVVKEIAKKANNNVDVWAIMDVEIEGYFEPNYRERLRLKEIQKIFYDYDKAKGYLKQHLKGN